MDLHELLSYTEEVSKKFIDKCETGRARSVETQKDLRQLLDKLSEFKKSHAELLKRIEPYAQGSFSGNVNEWPQLKPLLKDIFSNLSIGVEVKF